MLFYTHSFTAPLREFGVGKVKKRWYKVVFLPPELQATLPFKQYPRLRIDGEIGEMSLDNALMPTGDGRYYVIVAPRIIKQYGLSLGDSVELRFRIADQNWVEVPDALARALEADPLVQDAWNKLTAGKKRSLAQHVLSAKRAATQRKRVSEVIAAMLDYGADLRKRRADQ